MGIHDRLFGRLRAHQLLDSYALNVAPAAAAGGVGLSHLGHPIVALELFGATLLAAFALNSSGFPLHLMPVARTALRFLAPVAGVAVVLPIAAYGGHAVQLGAFTSPVLGAWLLMALGAWIAVRFESGSVVRVAVVGEPQLAALLSAELKSAGVHGYRVVGAIAPGARLPARRMEAGVPVLGSLEEMRRVVLRRSIDLLVHQSPAGDSHAGGVGRLEVFDRALRECMDLPVRMVEASRLYEELLGHVPVGAINSAWFQYMLHPRYRSTSTGAKRAADLLLGGIAAVVALPVIAVAAIAIKLDDGGPLFHRQRRAGEGGREFWVYKLRSMREDAESEGGARWSGHDDSRVTAVGRRLRASHVDELPQLWNVLRGEMTLVGPRPERPEIVADLERSIPYYERRHLVKPGITGWAQVRCGYSGSEFGSAWKLCHDLYYLKHRSLFGDLLILLETFRAVGHRSQYGQHAPDRSFILGGASAG